MGFDFLRHDKQCAVACNYCRESDQYRLFTVNLFHVGLILYWDKYPFSGDQQNTISTRQRDNKKYSQTDTIFTQVNGGKKDIYHIQWKVLSIEVVLYSYRFLIYGLSSVCIFSPTIFGFPKLDQIPNCRRQFGLLVLYPKK